MKRYERITAVFTSLMGVWIMVYAWQTLKLGSIHVPDAGFLPFLCGAALLLLGVVWMAILRTQQDKEATDGEQRLWYRPLVALVLMVVYGWLMDAVGYVTSTLLFVIVWQKVVERERWVKTIVIAVLATGAMYALFVHFLKVPVPPELILG